MAATLLLAGQLLYIVVTQFHVGGDANNHAAIFAAYAESGIWEAVHVAQFAGAAILLAGLFGLFLALEARTRGANLAGRLGAVSAVVALALYGVLQAVDGVGNKQVDHAWATAAGAEKASLFASAEAMRWLEWGVRSYLDYALGAALVLFATACARTSIVSRPIAYLMGVSGLTYLVQGWVVGAEGFSGTHTMFILLAWVFSLAWMIWLVVSTWRSEELVSARDAMSLASSG